MSRDLGDVTWPASLPANHESQGFAVAWGGLKNGILVDQKLLSFFGQMMEIMAGQPTPM